MTLYCEFNKKEQDCRNKKKTALKQSSCGVYGTRTRDLLRDRQAF